MKQLIGFLLLMVYSTSLGIAAYYLVPEYIFWANPICKNAGPLILLLVFGLGIVLFLVSLPIGLFALLCASKYALLNRLMAIITSIASGGLITVTLYNLWVDRQIGKAWDGLAWVMFGGVILVVMGFILCYYAQRDHEE